MELRCGRNLAAVVLALWLVSASAGTQQHGRQYELPEVQFEVVPAGSLDVGKGHIEALKDNAAKEGFFNKMFGTDCWSQALVVVQGQCKRLSSEQQARLAVALFNCHMRQAGRHTVKCTPELSIKDCTEHMDNAHFIIYSNFMQHVESMCLFIQNQDFNAYTEHLINTLHVATKDAAQSLSSVLSKLLAQEVTLTEMEAALSGVAMTQSQMAESVAEAAVGVQRLEQESAAITSQLQTSVAQGGELLRKQEDIGHGLAALEAQERAAADAALRQWAVAEERAEALAVSQMHYIKQQDRMLQETRMLSEHTAGLRSAVDVVLDYERRSDRLMLLMLGRSYTVEDILFYAGALVVGLFLTAARATRGARLPGLLLLASTLLAERLAVSSNSSLLEADEQGNVMLLLPSPAAFVNFAKSGDTKHISADGLEFTAVDYKWLVRRVWLSAGFALLVHCYLMYRNYERESYLLLRKVEGQLQEGQAALLESLATMRRQMESQHTELRRELLADMDSLLHAHPALSPTSGLPPSILQAQNRSMSPQEMLPLDRVPPSEAPSHEPGSQPQAAPLPFLRRLFSASFVSARQQPSTGQHIGRRVMSHPLPSADASIFGSSSPTAPHRPPFSPPAPTLHTTTAQPSPLRPAQMALPAHPQAHRVSAPQSEVAPRSPGVVDGTEQGVVENGSRRMDVMESREANLGNALSTGSAGGKRRHAESELDDVTAPGAKKHLRPSMQHAPAKLECLETESEPETKKRQDAVTGSTSRKRGRSGTAGELMERGRRLRPRRSTLAD